MSESAVDTYLETRGRGTLAFGDEDGGYAVPMSFGFDRENQRCVFQFVSTADSTKQAYLSDSNRVTLTVHDWSAIDDWTSVVVQGTLHELPADERAVAAATFKAHAAPVSFDVFNDGAADLEFEWYVLRVQSKTGQRGVARGGDN
ncbi:pyridoxamine 5'-phosphate oxidase family protein [Natrialbaceae archaeon A-arb3/5]